MFKYIFTLYILFIEHIHADKFSAFKWSNFRGLTKMDQIEKISNNFEEAIKKIFFKKKSFYFCTERYKYERAN